jgi:transmembrane sensor
MTKSRQADAWPAGRKAVEEAADWIAEAADGDFSLERRQALSHWLRRSPENIAAYIEVAAFWSDVPQAAPPQGFDLEKLVADARAEGNVIPIGQTAATPPAPQRPAPSRWRQYAAAAAVVAAVGIAVWGVDRWRGPVYATNVGEQRSMTLVDGSTIQMNARTRLRVRMDEDERSVALDEGQALFSVAKDAARPFVVTSGDVSVRAIGTQFDVDRKAARTTVTVLEGLVSVGAGPNLQAVQLPAGQQLSVHGMTMTPPEVVDLTVTTAWTDRRLVFQATPLGEVVEDFNRFSKRPLIVDNAELAALEISGVYTSTDPASLIRFLREQPGIRVEETDSRVVITRY